MSSHNIYKITTNEKCLLQGYSPVPGLSTGTAGPEVPRLMRRRLICSWKHGPEGQTSNQGRVEWHGSSKAHGQVGSIFMLSLCLTSASGHHLAFFPSLSWQTPSRCSLFCHTPKGQYLPEGIWTHMWCPSFCCYHPGDTPWSPGFSGQAAVCFAAKEL